MFKVGAKLSIWVLACVSLCALIGFLGLQQRFNKNYNNEIRHNENNHGVGQIEHYSIILDAGSTKTNSDLMVYKLNINNNLEPIISQSDCNQKSGNLSDFIQVKELSKCKNGGPLTEIDTIHDAHKILHNCTQQYVQQILTHNFTSESNQLIGSENTNSTIKLNMIKSAISTAHLSTGATAGMRTLSLVDGRGAERKISLLQQAANDKFISNSKRHDKYPIISLGKIAILTDEEEASFTWLTVNYLANLLKYNPINLIDDEQLFDGKTIGTIEMGGSSVQMAHQLEKLESKSKFHYVLNLFGISYDLIARSEKCLGIAQAKLRAQFISMRKALKEGNFRKSTLPLSSSTSTSNVNEIIEIDLPCWAQDDSGEMFTRDKFHKLSKEACLLGPISHETTKTDRIIEFLNQNPQIYGIKLVGKLDLQICNEIIADLLNPRYCQSNYRLCLSEPVLDGVPEGMPFIAVANFNLGPQGLGLKPSEDKELSQLEEKIANEWNYHSIDRIEFDTKLTKLCQLTSTQIVNSFPVRKEYASAACFTFSYNDNLMTQFYGFSTDQKTNGNKSNSS